jgi:hypothetical protein
MYRICCYQLYYVAAQFYILDKSSVLIFMYQMYQLYVVYQV